MCTSIMSDHILEIVKELEQPSQPGAYKLCRTLISIICLCNKGHAYEVALWHTSPDEMYAKLECYMDIVNIH